MPREAALAASQRVAIDTPSLKGSINLKGGRIDDLLLADYHVTVEPTSPLVELFSPVGSEHPYYAEFGWVAAQGGPAAPTADTLWQAEGGPLAPGKDVTLTWDNGAGLVFKRTYSVDPKYMFTVRQSVENTTGAPVSLYPYGLVNRTGLPQTAGYYILHEGLIAFLGEEGLQEVNYGDLDDTSAITPAKTPSRLARHHRQILGRRARSPPGHALPAALPEGRGRRAADLPGELPGRSRRRFRLAARPSTRACSSPARRRHRSSTPTRKS